MDSRGYYHTGEIHYPDSSVRHSAGLHGDWVDTSSDPHDFPLLEGIPGMQEITVPEEPRVILGKRDVDSRNTNSQEEHRALGPEQKRQRISPQPNQQFGALDIHMSTQPQSISQSSSEQAAFNYPAMGYASQAQVASIPSYHSAQNQQNQHNQQVAVPIQQSLAVVREQEYAPHSASDKGKRPAMDVEIASSSAEGQASIAATHLKANQPERERESAPTSQSAPVAPVAPVAPMAPVAPVMQITAAPSAASGAQPVEQQPSAPQVPVSAPAAPATPAKEDTTPTPKPTAAETPVNAASAIQFTTPRMGPPLFNTPGNDSIMSGDSEATAPLLPFTFTDELSALLEREPRPGRGGFLYYQPSSKSFTPRGPLGKDGKPLKPGSLPFDANAATVAAALQSLVGGPGGLNFAQQLQNQGQAEQREGQEKTDKGNSSSAPQNQQAQTSHQPQTPQLSRDNAGGITISQAQSQTLPHDLNMQGGAQLPSTPKAATTAQTSGQPQFQAPSASTQFLLDAVRAHARASLQAQHNAESQGRAASNQPVPQTPQQVSHTNSSTPVPGLQTPVMATNQSTPTPVPQNQTSLSQGQLQPSTPQPQQQQAQAPSSQTPQIPGVSAPQTPLQFPFQQNPLLQQFLPNLGGLPAGLAGAIQGLPAGFPQGLPPNLANLAGVPGLANLAAALNGASSASGLLPGLGAGLGQQGAFSFMNNLNNLTPQQLLAQHLSGQAANSGAESSNALANLTKQLAEQDEAKKKFRSEFNDPSNSLIVKAALGLTDLKGLGNGALNTAAFNTNPLANNPLALQALLAMPQMGPQLFGPLLPRLDALQGQIWPEASLDQVTSAISAIQQRINQIFGPFATVEKSPGDSLNFRHYQPPKPSAEGTPKRNKRSSEKARKKKEEEKKRQEEEERKREEEEEAERREKEEEERVAKEKEEAAARKKAMVDSGTDAAEVEQDEEMEDAPPPEVDVADPDERVASPAPVEEAMTAIEEDRNAEDKNVDDSASAKSTNTQGSRTTTPVADPDPLQKPDEDTPTAESEKGVHDRGCSPMHFENSEDEAEPEVPAGEDTTIMDTTVAEPEPAAPETETPEAPPKRRRGRPPKVKRNPHLARQAAQAKAAAQAAVTTPASKPASTPTVATPVTPATPASSVATPVKRKPGRPPKNPRPPVETAPEVQSQQPQPQPARRPPGRPRKVQPTDATPAAAAPKRSAGKQGADEEDTFSAELINTLLAAAVQVPAEPAAQKPQSQAQPQQAPAASVPAMAPMLINTAKADAGTPASGSERSGSLADEGERATPSKSRPGRKRKSVGAV